MILLKIVALVLDVANFSAGHFRKIAITVTNKRSGPAKL
jgi:hypothetical protein